MVVIWVVELRGCREGAHIGVLDRCRNELCYRNSNYDCGCGVSCVCEDCVGGSFDALMMHDCGKVGYDGSYDVVTGGGRGDEVMVVAVMISVLW